MRRLWCFLFHGKHRRLMANHEEWNAPIYCQKCHTWRYV